jgi:hypothetical protein
MITKQSLRMQALQIEALKIQWEHLLIVQKRHQSWITDNADKESDRSRCDIIDLIEEMVGQYDSLLQAPQGDMDQVSMDTGVDVLHKH